MVTSGWIVGVTCCELLIAADSSLRCQPQETADDGRTVVKSGFTPERKAAKLVLRPGRKSPEECMHGEAIFRQFFDQGSIP